MLLRTTHFTTKILFSIFVLALACFGGVLLFEPGSSDCAPCIGIFALWPMLGIGMTYLLWIRPTPWLSLAIIPYSAFAWLFLMAGYVVEAPPDGEAITVFDRPSDIGVAYKQLLASTAASGEHTPGNVFLYSSTAIALITPILIVSMIVFELLNRHHRKISPCLP